MSPAQKSKLLAWLRPLFAAAMLAIVAYNVPWRDRLAWEGASASAEVAGEIVGNWREPAIEFRVAPGETIDAGWPAALESRLATPGPVALDREALARDPEIAAGTVTWRPGMLRAFRDLEPAGVWSALGFLSLGLLASVSRWWRLLAIAGCATRWTSAMRLTLLGFFFNLVVPGLTGGDVIKAVLVVRENPARRADALMSVVVDRVLGLVTLMGLATAVVLMSGDRFRDLRWPVTLAFAAMAGGLWVVMHDWPRRLLRFDALLARLPLKEQVQNLDRAMRIVVAHPIELVAAFALSAFNHLCVAAAVWSLGHAFGDSLSYFEYVGVTSIANAVSALPIAPAGWGVGEAAFGYIFGLLGAAPSLGVAVSVTYRLLNMGIGLVGGLFLLLPGGRDVSREALEGARG